MLIAVHLADVLEWPTVAVGLFLAAGLVTASLRRVSDRDISRLGVLTAALFVASQIHMPVGVGSVHLLLNALAGVFLGRQVPVAILIALVLQSLLFAHGGLNALGVNVCIYSVPALLARPGLTWLSRRCAPFPAGMILGGVIATLTILFSAFMLAVGGEPTVRAAWRVVVIVNLPVIIVEAIITGVVIQYVIKSGRGWLVNGSPTPGTLRRMVLPTDQSQPAP